MLKKVNRSCWRTTSWRFASGPTGIEEGREIGLWGGGRGGHSNVWEWYHLNVMIYGRRACASFSLSPGGLWTFFLEKDAATFLPVGIIWKLRPPPPLLLIPQWSRLGTCFKWLITTWHRVPMNLIKFMHFQLLEIDPGPVLGTDSWLDRIWKGKRSLDHRINIDEAAGEKS